MTFLKGEDINIGVAIESDRNTPEAPTTWVPGRTASTIKPEIEKIPIRETRGSAISSQQYVIVKKGSAGDFEFNVRSDSFGYFMASLLGKVTTVANGDAFDHTFEVLTGNVQHPTLTLALSQKDKQHYQYPKVLVTAIELATPVNDLVNATVTFLGTGENAVSDYTPAFESTDRFFEHFNIEVKLASDVSGLAAASPVKLKEFSLSMNNSGRHNQNISELNPSDVLALMHEINGSMQIDYQDDTHHDHYVNNTYQAMQIKITQPDATISAGVNPEIVITLPKVNYSEYEQERDLDDIAVDSITFNANFDEAEGKAIEVKMTNLTANYS